MKSQNGYRYLLLLISVILVTCTKENTPPVALLTVYPIRGDSTTVFLFDATNSYDAEDYQGALTVRWDWESNCIWDTDYSKNHKVHHNFGISGFYTISMEVKDIGGQSNICDIDIIVGKNLMSSITDSRNGKIYKTVKIGSHWWFAENLTLGKIALYYTSQRNNDIIERYCYKNDSVYCNIYGGMYTWQEAMSYSVNQTSQGICPEDWHIPTKYEWECLYDQIPNIHHELIGENGLWGTEFLQWSYGINHDHYDNIFQWNYPVRPKYWTSAYQFDPPSGFATDPYIKWFGLQDNSEANYVRCVKDH